jgi:hypothetical protein
MSKSRVFGLRMTDADREAFGRAAAEAAVAVGRPVTLSGWMLSVLRDAVVNPVRPDGAVSPVAHDGPWTPPVESGVPDAKVERLAKARAAQASTVKARTPEEQAEFRRRMLSPSKGKRDE